MKQMMIVGGADESSKILIISIETAELRLKKKQEEEGTMM